MNNYALIAERIIEAQEAIIGPVAVEQARLVPNLQIDWPAHQIAIDGNESQTIDALVTQYAGIFGKVSIEVCKEAAASLLRELPAGKLPKSLL